MAVLTYPGDRKPVEDALSDWNGTQGIRWGWRALEYLASLGVSQKEAGRIMYEHVRAGGEIDRVEETRENWRHLQRHHYDLRLKLDGREVSYVEMILIDDSRVQPAHLVVVNAKRK